MSEKIAMKTLTINETTFEVVDGYCRDNKPDAVIDNSTTGAGHLEFNDKTLYPKTLLDQIQTINELKELILNTFYPVGTIYMSAASANPSTYLGGTWQEWGSGRVPVGVDISNTNFETVEKTGGKETYTLTTEQLPSHTHDFTTSENTHYHLTDIFVSKKEAPGHGLTSGGAFIDRVLVSAGVVVNDNGTIAPNTHKHTGTTDSSGNNQAINNLQPYITCYMWKRVS